MATIRDLVRYNVSLCSETIHDLKVSAAAAASTGERIFAGPCLATWTRQPQDHSVPIPNHPADPRHPDHRKYMSLKRECSVWLTALKILKIDRYEFKYDTICRIQRDDGMFLQSFAPVLTTHCRGRYDLLLLACDRLVLANEQLTKGRRKDVTWNNYGEPKQLKTTYQPIDWRWLDAWVLEREAAIAKAKALKEAKAAKEAAAIHG